MLKINLLPVVQQKSGGSRAVERFQSVPILWIGFGLVIALGAVPFGIGQARQGQLKALKAEIARMNPKREEVDRVQALLERLRGQEVAFNALSQDESSWAGRLNALSDLTPEGVWFSEFSLDMKKGLIIRGLAIGEGGVEMVRVGRLVQDLKEDSGFSSIVKDVQIESIKRVQEERLEIVQFTLSCTLLKGADA